MEAPPQPRKKALRLVELARAATSRLAPAGYLVPFLLLPTRPAKHTASMAAPGHCNVWHAKSRLGRPAPYDRLTAQIATSVLPGSAGT